MHSAKRIPFSLWNVSTRNMWIVSPKLVQAGVDRLTNVPVFQLQSEDISKSISYPLLRLEQPMEDLKWHFKKHCVNCSALCIKSLLTNGNSKFWHKYPINTYMFKCPDCDRLGLPVVLSMELGSKLVEDAQKLLEEDNPSKVEEVMALSLAVVTSWPTDSAAHTNMGHAFLKKYESISNKLYLNSANYHFKRAKELAIDGSHKYLIPHLNEMITYCNNLITN